MDSKRKRLKAITHDNRRVLNENLARYAHPTQSLADKPPSTWSDQNHKPLRLEPSCEARGLTIQKAETLLDWIRPKFSRWDAQGAVFRWDAPGYPYFLLIWSGKHKNTVYALEAKTR